jgi:hypothetical protein
MGAFEITTVFNFGFFKFYLSVLRNEVGAVV